MQFEFDEAKRAANYAKHEVDFLLGARALLDPLRLEWVDDRNDYGEERWVCIGAFAGRHYVLVYTLRGDVVRIISARKANEREEAKYRSV
jgi:hypothetical protein